MEVMFSINRFDERVPASARYVLCSQHISAKEIAQAGHDGIAEVIINDFKKIFDNISSDGDDIIIEGYASNAGARPIKAMATLGPPLRLTFGIAKIKKGHDVREVCDGVLFIEFEDFINSGLNTKEVFDFIELVIKVEKDK